MSTEKVAHSPLPWRLSIPSDSENDPALGMADGAYVMGGDGPDDVIADCAYGEEGLANAALIVRCVNAHEGLVEALKAIIDGSADRKSVAEFGGNTLDDALLAQARAALAMAEGK